MTWPTLLGRGVGPVARTGASAVQKYLTDTKGFFLFYSASALTASNRRFGHFDKREREGERRVGGKKSEIELRLLKLHDRLQSSPSPSPSLFVIRVIYFAVIILNTLVSLYYFIFYCIYVKILCAIQPENPKGR